MTYIPVVLMVRLQVEAHCIGNFLHLKKIRNTRSTKMINRTIKRQIISFMNMLIWNYLWEEITDNHTIKLIDTTWCLRSSLFLTFILHSKTKINQSIKCPLKLCQTATLCLILFPTRKRTTKQEKWNNFAKSEEQNENVSKISRGQ